MVFSSVIFLFYFLPSLFLLYFLIPAKWLSWRNFALLLWSLFFYAYGEPTHIIVMLASVVINYFLGLAIEQERERTGKYYVTFLAITINLGLLIYYKYAAFLVGSWFSLLGTSGTLPNIALPIGISFYTFQGLSYLLDVRSGKADAQRNLLDLMLYIAFFSQLIAGPIVRYDIFAWQVRKRQESGDLFASGVRRFIIGLAKKIILANTLGALGDEILRKPAGSLVTATAWIGLLAYSMQIYFDFSGYSDMAIGLGRMFGFTFPENFNYPYISRSITEFWRRWHISLSTWFRDYVYIPLGGNYVSIGRNIFNVMLVWVLTGAWHGASWNFVLWGSYFGILLLMEKYVWGRFLSHLRRPFQTIYMLFLVMMGWTMFYTTDLSALSGLLRNLFGIATPFWNKQTVYYLYQYGLVLLLSILACIPWQEILSSSYQKRIDLNLQRWLSHAADFALLLLLVVSTVYLIRSNYNPFIYFRF